jgi:hypothetical protein
MKTKTWHNTPVRYNKSSSKCKVYSYQCLHLQRSQKQKSLDALQDLRKTGISQS